MSSSASQNKNQQTVTFKGRVLHTQTFSALCASDAKAQEVADAFKQYWKNGYHPDLGKDIPFARPKEILNLHVRHTHVDTGNYVPEDSQKDKNGKKSAWDKWKKIGSVKFTYSPTSNSYLVYSVNNNRDALLMFFVDKDAHSLSELDAFTDKAISITYAFFESTESGAMPLDEDLFSDKWKLP
ncbi:hypothetical protein [Kosakonia pseudosacchari]|uniref:hypothetical protein n=1 Tax=Kosakonia pseudosacchari TaxID=1646340 RepID=UPI003D952884